VKTAIIMMNMGGPESLDNVEPFLYNLFMDPDIIDIPLGRLFRPLIARKIAKSRASKAKEYYKQIGGKSPLLDLTLDQAASLETAIKDEGIFKTYVAMRYTHPFTDEAIDVIYKNSGGTPRMVNILCDRALLAGFISETNRIDEHIIHKCIREVVCK